MSRAPKRRQIFELLRELGRARVEDTPLRTLAAILRDRLGDEAPHLSTIADAKTLWLADVEHEEKRAERERERFSYAGLVARNLWRFAEERRGEAFVTAAELHALIDPQKIYLPSALNTGRFSFGCELWRVKHEHRGEAHALAEELDSLIVDARAEASADEVEWALRDALDWLLRADGGWPQQ
jgi:hypothetical protein